MWKLGKITAKTHIGDYGQIVDSFVLLLKDTCCEEVKMTNGTDFILEKNYNDLTGKVNAKGVTEISICETEEGTEVELILDPFVYRYDFKVTGTIAGTEVYFIRADVDVRKTLSSINNRIVSSLEQFINQNGDIT